MGKPKQDLTGMRFGKLLVIRKGDSKGHGNTTWTCLCDCGNTKDIRMDHLKSGKSQSCGRCKRSDKGIENRYEWEKISIRVIEENAKKERLTFGQYVQSALFSVRTKGGVAK